MANWNAQMMLDLYIYNYLMKKNMNTTAEIFASEANFCPKAVVVDPPEGFLSEWWSIFWSVYSTRIATNLNTDEGSSSKAPQSVVNAPRVVVHPTRIVSGSNVSSMINDTYTTTQMPELPNLPQLTNPAMPKPNTEKLLHSSISATMARSNPNLNRFIPVRISDQSVISEGKVMSLIDAMRDQDRLRLPMDELACMLPSSSSTNCSHPQEKVNKKRPLCITEDGNSHTSLRIKEPTDASVRDQDRLGLTIENINSNSQLLDANQLTRLLSSSNTSSNPQKNVSKSKLSITRDEDSGTSSRRHTDEEPTHNAPKGMTSCAFNHKSISRLLLDVNTRHTQQAN